VSVRSPVEAIAVSPIGKTLSVLSLGLLLALMLAFGAGGEGKGVIVVLGFLAGVSAIPVVLYFGSLAETGLLVALMATLSISLKVHPIYRADHMGGAAGVRISITDILLFAILVYLIVKARGTFRTRIEIPTSILVAMAVYLLFCIVSTMASPDPEMGVFQILATVQTFAVFVFLSNYIDTPGKFRIAVAGMLLGAFAQSGVALGQYKFPGRFEFKMLGAQEQEDLKVSASGDIDLPSVDLGQTTIGGEVVTRPMGMLIHSNLLGTFLALQIIVAGALFLSTSSTLLGLWSAAVAAAGATALIVTYSRSGWAAAGLGLALWWVLAWKYRALRLTFRQKAAVALLLIVAVGALIKVAPKIYLRLTETAGEALTFRKDLAAAAWKMTMHNPLTGIGLNTFVDQLPPYDPAQTSRLKAYPVHDIFLLESSETGLGGGVAFLALAVLTISKSFVYAVNCQSRTRRLFGLALFGAIASYWVADLFAFMFRMQVLAAVVWGLLALSFANRMIDQASFEETL
jgi:O-antigen ligase